MVTIILAIGIIALFFIGLSVRLIFLKDGEFKGTCASQSPELMKRGVDCGCGKKVGECQTGKMQEMHQAQKIAQ